ncbi:AAA family ATPase [Clostridium sediminicola]|uniref:AAA family ATPase n=1 Tax=Clostridium sediminicola TaxID=3114879 RepID=UPI003D168583
MHEIKQNVNKVVVGKEDVIELLLSAILAEGHVLLEDLPGTGKTLLAKSIAKSMGGSFNRIQFTPDLLPSDITGFKFYDMKTGEFNYQQGPVMTNILLADEINRTIPRTQSSLLESMGEYQVTVDNTTYHLPKPFFVIATQNPIDLEGTYPLPEAQLDRFLFKLSLGFPTAEEEMDILNRFQNENPLDTLESITKPEEIAQMINDVKNIIIAENIKKYIIEIINSTRTSELFSVGASTRGTMCLMRGSQALAALKGRDYVIPDDVKYIVPFVLCHRLKLNDKERMKGTLVRNVLEDLLQKIPVPLA